MISRVNLIAETYGERPSDIIFGDNPEYSNTQRFLLDEAYAYQLITEKEKAYKKAREEAENNNNNQNNSKNKKEGIDLLKGLASGNF
jgi:hypothetical protein